MGVLKELRTGKRILLDAENVVGRSPRCELRFVSNLVSSIHASLRWQPGGWEVKDLGSRNGTFVDGEKLEPGQVRMLGRSQTLAFGSTADVWELIDESAPQPLAVSDDGDCVQPVDELIALPSVDDPIVTIYRGSDGTWYLEGPGETSRPVLNGEHFEVKGRTFRFSCPQPANATYVAENDVQAIRLSFAVSSDEEDVALTAHVRGKTIDLGTRAHNYLLLTLARRRREDAVSGLPPGSCGWIYQDELAKALATQPDKMNVDIFRIRRRFAQYFPNAAQIIERRSGSRQLRLGVSEIQIDRI
jgi:hypothetical protein